MTRGDGAVRAAGRDGTAAINVRIGICLIRAHDYHSRSTAVERFDVAVHSTTAILVKTELFWATPLLERTVELAGQLLEHCAAKHTATPEDSATAIGLTNAIEFG